MTPLSKLFARGAVAAVFGVGAIVAMTTTASAYVACNRYGDCWQTSQRYHYPVHLQVRFHDGSDSDWRQHHHRGHRWHDESDHDNGFWDSDRNWHNAEERNHNNGYWDNNRDWHNN